MVKHPPFFIVGAGRSGTTLLRLILSGHSRLVIPPETWFIRPLVRALPINNPLSPAQVEQAVRIITNDYRWPDMGMQAETLSRQAASLTSPRLADLVNLVYQHHLEESGKARLGDKTPIYIEILPELASMYPGARFIHLIRDGRDVAISWMDVRWNRYHERNAFEWPRAMRYRQSYLNTPIASQILEVRYEDLVNDPEQTVHLICDFIGEKVEPEMFDWQHRTELVPERERRIHGRLKRPISRDAIAVWRQKLRPWECFAMEACLHKDLLQLGYPLRFAAPFWRPFLAAAGFFLHTSSPVLTRAIPHLQRWKLLPRAIYI